MLLRLFGSDTYASKEDGNHYIISDTTKDVTLAKFFESFSQKA